MFGVSKIISDFVQNGHFLIQKISRSMTRYLKYSFSSYAFISSIDAELFTLSYGIKIFDA